MNLTCRFLTSLLVLTAFVCAGEPAAKAAAPNSKTKDGAEISTVGSHMVSNTANALTNYNAAALHRLDFKVVGKSCAVCLLGIQKRISLVPGVVKAAVQLQRPYAAVVIYDSSKTTSDKILAKGKETVPEVTFERREDHAIAKMPVVLIPKIDGETPAKE